MASVMVPHVPAVADKNTPRRVTLGAVNTFTASTIAGIRVRIPAPASYPVAGDNPYVSVTGTGRMVGYVLFQEGVRVSERISRITTHSRFCNEPGCDRGDPFVWHSGSRIPAADGVATLPAGDYILYVIADENPVTVTLRFDGLAGKRRVDLSQPADAAIVEPPVHGPYGPTKSVYWFGEEVEFSGSSGIVIPLMRFRTGESAVNRHELCYHNREDPVDPGEAKYAPGCPLADFRLSITLFDFISHREFVEGYYIQASGPRWGFGMNYVIGGHVHEADSMLLYIDGDLDELQG